MRSACSVLVTLTMCVVLLADHSHLLASNRTRRIYQGVEDRDEDYPFVVALLRVFRVRICSGTVIHTRWVLTTANCRLATHVQYGDMRVPRVNITNLSLILKYLTHPNFIEYRYFPRHVRFYNDLGLLWVEKLPLRFISLSAIDYKALWGIPVTYVGVGISDVSNQQTYDNVENRLIGYGVVSSCTDVAKHLFAYPKICVSSRCKLKQSALPGDSGGPLILDGKLIGITVAILYERGITIFTPISPSLTWIVHNIRAHE